MVEKSEVFEGHSSEMRKDAPWLASEDILDKGDVPVTIEGAFRHENVAFDKGRVEAEVYALKFQKADKQLVLNATNRKTLVELFGTNVKNWASKKIVLFTVKTKFAGKDVNGIRVKGIK